ncbi:MAG: alpha/beta hydrolase, partial [Deltaproteobacteria bacterium]|nr:alpha/beta hydrolase [Deltaproteobacteria bacterium]
MLRLDDLSGNSRIDTRTPARARAQLAEDCGGAQLAVSEPVETHELELAGPAGPIPARRYTPPGLPAGSPGIVFFHGGGFVTGDLDSHDPLCRVLAIRGGVRVIAVDYRLAPEHAFPAAVDDCVAAFRAVVGRAAELGVDARRLAVAGDSAGGNLSAVVALRTRDDAVPPALQALLYPCVDATCSEPSHRTLADGYFLTAAGI